VTLEASVDYDRYRLKARSRHAQVSAALGTKASLSDSKAGIQGRPAELEMKIGKAAASARFATRAAAMRLRGLPISGPSWTLSAIRLRRRSMPRPCR